MTKHIIFVFTFCFSVAMVDDTTHSFVVRHAISGEVYTIEYASSDDLKHFPDLILEKLGGNEADHTVVLIDNAGQKLFYLEAHEAIKRHEILSVMLSCKYEENIRLSISVFGVLENPPIRRFMRSNLTEFPYIDEYPHAVGVRVLIDEYEHPEETFFLVNAEPPVGGMSLDSWFIDNIPNIVLFIKIQPIRNDIPAAIWHYVTTGLNVRNLSRCF